MQRRKFIKDTLTGLPILIMTPSILASSCNKDDDNEPNGKTIVVIGAGISGQQLQKIK